MGLSPSQIVRGLVRRILPVPVNDAPEAEGPLRTGRYFDLRVESAYPTDHLQADEGSLLIASILPGATALQQGLVAAWANNTCTILVQNTDSGPNAKSTWLKKLKFSCNIAPTSATALRMSVVIDQALRTPTTIAVPAGSPIGPGTPATASCYPVPIVSPRSSINAAPVTKVFFPLSTAAGAPPAIPVQSPGARTPIGNHLLKGSIPVVLDGYCVQFGSADDGGAYQGAAALAKVVEQVDPIIIDPGHSAAITLWAPGNVTAGMAFDEMRLSFLEK